MLKEVDSKFREHLCVAKTNSLFSKGRRPKYSQFVVNTESYIKWPREAQNISESYVVVKSTRHKKLL
jgi:hypothetical protein